MKGATRMMAAATRSALGNRSAILTGVATVILGLAAAYILVNGSAKMLLFLPGLVLVGVGLFHPQVLLWVLIGVTVCFSGSEYGIGDQSVFQPGAYILDPFRFNISQILILVMVVILLARALSGVRPMRRLPKAVWIPAALFLCVFLFQVARGLAEGVAYNEIVEPFNGIYVPFALAAFWCFTQILDTPRMRLRLLDALFIMASGRALFALFRYFLGNGDTANAYRDTGVKVALWETADHTLFILLIVIAIAGWATHRLTRRRSALWLTGAGFMALTVLLSFRRMSWFGLAAAIAVTAILIAPRSQRAAALFPGLFVMGAGIVAFARERFSGSGSLLSRVFSDFVANKGPTRQQEWGLAWETIVRNPFAGDIAARRAGSSFAFWDTRIVHSAFLFSWMKFGLLGLVALMILPLTCVWYAVRAVRAHGAEEHIAFGLLGLAPFVLAYAVMADPLIEIRTLIMFAIAGALGVLVWIQRDAGVRQNEGPEVER